MTQTAPPLDPKHEKALQALIAWWEDAGIELETPVIRPRANLPASGSGTTASRAQPPARTSQTPGQVHAATAAAARAAGYGQPETNGPSAQELASKADTLEDLQAAIEEFEGCSLKRTARNTVFARGNRAARIMIIGEAPGKEEDETGEPFRGAAGHLLDRMFASIGLADDALYMSNILNWRPPGNRAPTQEEIALCLPFIERHIALKKPDILVLVGGLAAQSLLRDTTGITRMRGQWREYAVRDAKGDASGQTLPALPIFHPSYLLRRPPEKRQAWVDMLTLASRINAAQ